MEKTNTEYVVRMKGITKVYPNGIAANQNVDFEVKEGEIHALMGENGAGKSTLMKMLFGLEQPTRMAGRTRWKLAGQAQECNDEINGILNETLSVSGQLLEIGRAHV